MQQLLPRATLRHRYGIRPSLGAFEDTVEAATQLAPATTQLARASTGTQIMTGAGATILAAAPFTGPAAPFVAVAGLVTSFLGSFGIGSGCGQTCVLSTQYANRAEQILTQNIATYFSLPAPRSRTARDAALRIFDAVWADLSQQCSNPQLADAGQRCISDRQAGACKWRQTADSPLLAYPNEPQPGECWNWFSGYRDPIAKDNVTNDPADTSVGTTTLLSDLAAGRSGIDPRLVIGGAVLILALAMAGKE